MIHLQTPLSDDIISDLKAGDIITLTGVIYSARDAAHKLINEALDENKPLPFALDGQTIYYAGPTPPKPGQIIGSCGPTTSGRMDAYSPRLMSLGLRAMIGKGERSREVIDAIQKYGCVYLASIGGAAALIGEHITSCEIIAYPWLGAEAVRKLWVEEYPCVVAVDCHGGNVYEEGVKRWRKSGA